MILNERQFVQVPVMLECFELFFLTIRVTYQEGLEILDFSRPALHHYSQRGVSFHFPSVPEDDVLDAYTKQYLPKPGDVVWDVGAHAGRSSFNMDGTMSAGIHEFLVYSGTGRLTDVDTLTIADACQELGSVPAFIKMDIEGAEVAAIEGSAEFLKRHAIHFAIESSHRIGGLLTHQLLDELFPRPGYQVNSENYCGQMFTWAEEGARK